LPRAWIVHAVQQTDSSAETLELLAGATLDPRTTAVMTTAPPILAQPESIIAETAKVTTTTDNAITVAVHAKAAGLVILSEIYDSGWNVYVDGKRSTLYQTDAILRGVAVAAGDHKVEFRYEPRSLTIGIAVSSVAALLVLVIAGWAVIGWLRDPVRRRSNSNRDIDPAII